MDLWVLPTPSESQWFARIDWYLNWQMCKGLAFEKARPSVELFRILEEGELQFEASVSDPSWPLMVMSHGRIPCSKCMVIDPRGSLDGWLNRAFEQAQKLKVRSLRLFLPKNAEKSQAESLWRGLNKDTSITTEFCMDEEAL
jgi:hypothetical protein